MAETVGNWQIRLLSLYYYCMTKELIDSWSVSASDIHSHEKRELSGVLFTVRWTVIASERERKRSTASRDLGIIARVLFISVTVTFFVNFYFVILLLNFLLFEIYISSIYSDWTWFCRGRRLEANSQQHWWRSELTDRKLCDIINSTKLYFN